MTTISHWMHVDLFTVEQAAALWAGFDPARLSPADSFKPSEMIAARQMLTGAIIDRELPARAEGNPLAIINNHNSSMISRADLEAFARNRDLFPAFLFDTLAPLESTGGSFSDDTPRLRAIDPVPTSPPPNRGGRPQEHDWNTFILEIISRANRPDGLPDTQAELVREMLGWFQSTFGKEPAESAVKERISKIYRYMAEAKNLDD
jgi:hypothetical protein